MSIFCSKFSEIQLKTIACGSTLRKPLLPIAIRDSLSQRTRTVLSGTIPKSPPTKSARTWIACWPRWVFPKPSGRPFFGVIPAALSSWMMKMEGEPPRRLVSPYQLSLT
jgi:hypothetical protein